MGVTERFPDRRGISPIVASIIVILVAVTLAGTYTVWANQLFGGLGEETGKEVERTTKELYSAFEIVSASDQNIFIKNTGGSKLSASALDILLNNEPVDFSPGFSTLDKGETGSLRLMDIWTHGPGRHGLEISGGRFSDSAGLKIEPHRSVVGDWRFEEGTGDTVEDSSGNGNAGTLVNGPTWSRDTVHDSSDFSLSLDGSDDWVRIDSIVPSRREGSFSSWIKVEEVHAAQIVYIAELTGNGGGAEEELHTGTSGGGDALNWIFSSDAENGNKYAINGGSYADGEWHHILGTYRNNDFIELYVDGELVAEDKQDRNIDTSKWVAPTNIGKPRADDRYLKGLIDNIAIYNQPLEPDELYTLSLV